MRRAISAVLFLLALVMAAHTSLAIEMTWEFSVQVSATVQASPARITLSWPQDQYTTPNSYTIYRKAPSDTSWGSGVSLSGTSTSYVDNNVTVGTAYEYQIVKVTSQYTGYGYIYSGINVPMTESRGKLLLVVDKTYASNLVNELAQLQQDLIGDGWTVVRLDVNRDDPVTSVKSLITAQYAADPANVKCVFLFGHVPVPYSGNLVPDGHTPDHQGAWPADGYYGDMDGTWTDNSVNVTGQYDPRNTNVPGDGKFDQSTFPATVKLMVGRVDLANMPGAQWTGGPATFPSELDLLRNYLNKDHKFRTKQFDLPRQGLVGDFFGVRNGEAFAASGWRNFAPFFGANNVASTPTQGTWTPTLADTGYLWAYGAGAGSFGSVSGLGNSDAYYNLLTRELYANDIKSAFVFLFGSWLGDWDSSDNIMRAVLALPSYGLACAWSGRPHWFVHHMALGETIGYGARLTMNNGSSGLYQNQINTAAGMVHIGLMGDPSLRMHIVAPPANVTATTNSGSVTLNWTASTDSVLGYHVYRAQNGSFTRVTAAPVTTTSFTDASATGATNYMVRALKLETSGSGTYYNLSLGAFVSSVGSGTTSGTNNTNVGTTPTTTVYFDDAVPAGALARGAGGDRWNWVSSNPTPYSGALCNLSSLGAGLHEHFFSYATQTLPVNSGEVLTAYVYIDPANPPSEIMLQWFNGSSWEHRAYWGANNIGYGTAGTSSRVYMGPLPAAGQWTLLQVPASQVGLEGNTISGMALSQFDGRAAWDKIGKASALLPPSGSTNSTSTGNTNTNSTGSSGGSTNGSGAGPVSIANPVIWVDDSAPAGAVTDADGGDSWNWINSNPAPFSGTRCTQSSIAAGPHEYFFSWATQTLRVDAGDILFAYVYVDPNNIPSELMLQWTDGSWEHRAYWGANNINNGTPGTPGRVYMGPIPQAGQWALLQVPASKVALEGATLTGMAFSQFGGRAAWDYTGKGSGLITNTAAGSTGTGTGSSGGSSTSTNSNSGNTDPTATLVNPVPYVDDDLPPGAVAGSDGGDSWNWVGSNPSPLHGSLSSLSSSGAGLHEHYFQWASHTLAVNNGEILFAYVYIDPNSPPSEVMLQWFSDTWEHRAYWGANNIHNGTAGTVSQVYMGPVPPAGQWTLLQVPASLVGLEGSSISGMAFSQFDGRAAWDYAGKATSVLATPPTTGGNSGSTNLSGTLTNFTAWVDDSLPEGALPASDGGDSWNWVSSNPAPYSGSQCSLSSVGAGLHQHFFSQAGRTLTVNAGDVLCAYVYVDPNNVPSELMLQWNDSTGSWHHRAYWGANNIDYGMPGTVSRTYMGPVPAAGKWVLLQVPASQVGLEGSTLTGMAFSQYDGRAAWDYAGKFSVAAAPTGTGLSGSSGTTSNAVGTGTSDGTTTNTGIATNITTGGTSPGGTTTNTTTLTGTNIVSGTNQADFFSNSIPGVSSIDYVSLRLPKVGDNGLKILTPTLLELKLINTKQPDPAQVTQWNLVDSSGNFRAPVTSAFTVLANGSPVGVASVGFKRRPLYAPMLGYDLRIENSLYLQLSAPLSDNQNIEVRNNDGTLWSSSTQYAASMDPLRYSPAVHVNQEGYMPNYSKVAMVGYYAGSFGEVIIPASAGFKIVDAATGAQVFQGTLTQRPDSGYTYSPTPYQKVYQADFTSFNTPGLYRLVVPGMGGSLPFRIDDGIAMDFARAYALGLYHQRCGTNTAMPVTRFTHDACHTAPVAVPTTSSDYPFTWNTIAGYANTINENNPPQTAPALTSPSAQLFPFVEEGPLDVSGGHHDAGDYSRYTINSASLVHYLMFAVDSLPGVADLDNLGIPESGDGISDVLQEAKWEADFLAKMQDSDGGFYFLVYPKDREYEGNVTPDHGDAQVVWPKTTSVTAASVAALAQCATSPVFKQAYPAAAERYLAQANLGWQFLMNAINTYGKNGAYQKITHYGDNFADDDELAWAACQMYLATGDPSIHQLLLSWFDPSNPATWRWGWWHMSECFGHAIRSYAFAVQSGRATVGQLDASFLSSCRSQIAAAANDMLTFSQQTAYGTSLPVNTKAMRTSGWYFSTDQAFDLAVAYVLNPQASYMKAMVANMNYEGGCNPVNVSYVTGLGWKRQRDIVSQWALNDTHVLPPSGIPVGNITGRFGYLWNYAGSLEALCYPSDDATVAPYPVYDRWGDSWNVNAEMVVLNQARSIGTLAFLAAQTAYKTQAWKAPSDAQIVVPNGTTPIGAPVTLSLQVPGMDLSTARITWEARDQEPAFGGTFTFAPQNNGAQWVEAEAQWPDGRRVFARGSFNVNSADIIWVDDTLPAGATPGSDGGDSWNWVSSNPAPFSGIVAHQSGIAAGEHQDYFSGATATLTIGTGDVLYAWVYLDPSNRPSELMLQWNDGTSWEHRAYWGANNLHFGLEGTPGRVYVGVLPPAGQWVQLRVAASRLGLEGKTLTGLAFTLYGGRVTWDAAGRLTAAAANLAKVSVSASKPLALRTTASPGAFTLTRVGSTNSDLLVNYTLAGAAVGGLDYDLSPATPVLSSSLVIPAGASSATVAVLPLPSTNLIVSRDVSLTLAPNTNYSLVPALSATVTVSGNSMPVKLSFSTSGTTLTWDSITSHSYQIFFKENLRDADWIPIGSVTARDSTSSWVDSAAPAQGQRFYAVAQVD